MTSLSALLLELMEAFPDVVGNVGAGAIVEVVEAALDLPVECRITPGGEYLVSPPRGILATGFDSPHGRLVARFDRGPWTGSAA